MHIYPQTNKTTRHQLKHVSPETFMERLRELSDEFNGNSSFLANKLYLRKKSSPFELDVTEDNGEVLLKSSMLWSYKFIIGLQTVMFVIFIIIGLSGTGISVISYIGIIGYLLVTFLTNSGIRNISDEYYKLIKSLDYDMKE